MRRFQRWVDQRNYSTTGVNGDLLHWIESSAFAQRHFSRTKVNINLLIKALLSDDEASRDLSSKEAIKLLWSSHEELGPYPFLDTLSHFQFDRKFYKNYRDHVSHQLKVFLLGMWIYHECPLIRDGLAEEFDLPAAGTEDEFFRRWLATSVYHDIGYVLENDEALQNRGEGWESTRKILNETLAAPVSAVSSCARYLSSEDEHAFCQDHHHQMHGYKVVTTFTDLCALRQPGDIFKHLEYEARKAGVRSAASRRFGLQEYWDYARSTDQKDGRGRFLDHGIASALLLIQTWTAFKNRSLELVRVGKKSDGEWHDHLRKLNRGLDGAWSTIRAAAAAMALHNINQSQWDKAHLRSNKMDLSHFRIHLIDSRRKTPLAFLLAFVDTLQDWDRPKYRAATEKDRSLLDQDLSLKIEKGRVLIHVLGDAALYRRPEVVDGTGYSKVRKVMHEYLEEDAVNRLFGWTDEDETADFSQLLKEVDTEFARGGTYAEFRQAEGQQEVTRDYLARIALQKLLHAAHKIDKRAASANLWICASIARRRASSLRSDEREGYFSVQQLVTIEHGRVTHRHLPVRYNRAEKSELATAALCVVDRKPVLQRISASQFPSRPEMLRNVTHIVGIPAARPPIRINSPMSITVDLSCTAGFSRDEEVEVKSRAKLLSRTFGRVAQWIFD